MINLSVRTQNNFKNPYLVRILKNEPLYNKLTIAFILSLFFKRFILIFVHLFLTFLIKIKSIDLLLFAFTSIKMSHFSMVVTDLDGTLLSPEGTVGITDIITLKELGEKGIIRVIATGRSPYSFDKVIPVDFPIDYLIFSSGAGAMEWKSKDLLYTTELSCTDVQTVADVFVNRGINFMVHEPIPANHRFLYFSSGNHNPDFLRRIEVYKPFCQPYIPGVTYCSIATQILAVIPFDIKLFEELRHEFPTLKVIRTTSPLDGNSIWVEIFAPKVSKAFGIEWICKSLNISKDGVIAVGNDFNDLDMLSYIEKSYVVMNAPLELRNQFTTVKSNSDSGFSHAVELGFAEFIEKGQKL